MPASSSSCRRRARTWHPSRRDRGLTHYNLGARARSCGGGFDNQQLSADTREVDVELRLSHTWDLPNVRVDLGVAAGAVLLSQRFTTAGVAPARDGVAGQAGAWLGVSVDVWRGLAVTADVTLATYAFRELAIDGSAGFGLHPTWRAALGLVERF